MSQVNSDAPPSPPPPAPERRVAVRAAIVVACAMFAAAGGLLYYRWVTMHEPNCVLVVETSPQLRGGQVIVDGVGLTAPHKAEIGVSDRYVLPFYLNPGEYTVRVDVDHETVVTTPVAMRRDMMQTLNFTKIRPPSPRPSATLPATAPALVP